MNNQRNKQHLYEDECNIPYQVNKDVMGVLEKQVVDYIKED